MKNEAKRESDAAVIRALPIIGPLLAMACMLIVAAVAASAVMMMM